MPYAMNQRSGLSISPLRSFINHQTTVFQLFQSTTCNNNLPSDVPDIIIHCSYCPAWRRWSLNLYVANCVINNWTITIQNSFTYTSSMSNSAVKHCVRLLIVSVGRPWNQFGNLLISSVVSGWTKP